MAANSDSLVNSIINKFESCKSRSAQQAKHPSAPCIYKVPPHLRKVDENAYNPRLFSIGPIHSNDKRLWPMDYHKLYFTNYLMLQTASSDEASQVLKECSNFVVKALPEALSCYTESPESESDKSPAEMMLMDGCFILGLLYKSFRIDVHNEKITTDNPLFGKTLEMALVRHDLLLLENQIPFFVLEGLFDLTIRRIPADHLPSSIADLVISFFGNVMSFEQNNTITKQGESPDYYHILHLLHTCYSPPPGDESPARHAPTEGLGSIFFPEKESHTRFLSTASKLDWAGVKFVPIKGSNPFDVKFHPAEGLFWWLRRASFQVPPLSIYDSTVSLLRNLIAFEQCCHGVPRLFTSYAFLMDRLINSEKDVELLEKEKVLYNYLGASEDASELFNGLCKHVVLGSYYFDKPCHDASSHCRKRWPRFLVSLRRDYFNNPWAIIAVLAAFVIFGLTVVSTVYSVLSYY